TRAADALNRTGPGAGHGVVFTSEVHSARITVPRPAREAARMQDGSGRNSRTRISTGNPRLDDIVGGGFDPHRLYLYGGRRGAGRTTLARQFLLDGEPDGGRVLHITLSEGERELERGAARRGWDLSGVEVVYMVPCEEMLGPEQEMTLL